MGPHYLLGMTAFCLLLPSIGTSTTDVIPADLPLPTSTSQVDLSTRTTSPKTTLKPTTLDPKEAARQAALELSKEIFRNITKQLRDSIASKDFSVFTTTAVNQDEQDDLHPFRHQPKHHHEHHWGPYFDEPVSGSGALQVKAHLASEAILNCRVGMLRDKTVMWLRRMADKVHLLTVGANTYSGDSRVAVKFQYPNNWRLSISPVQRDDAGLYMCQVSTHPPRVLLTNVTVLAPILKIVDEQGHEVRDRYYKAGSSVELSCRVSRAYTGNLNSATTTLPSVFKIQTTTTTTSTTTLQPMIVSTNIYNDTISNSNNSSNINETFSMSTAARLQTNSSSLTKEQDNTPENNNFFGITWFKDGKVLTDKVTSRNMSSTFKLKHADQKDSGAYSCTILNTSTVTVQVQILSGETQAAVQHDTLNKGASRILSSFTFVFSFFIVSTKFID